MFTKVYLAGPIAGLTEGEAKDWRNDVAHDLKIAGFIPVSPLRSEPAINGIYQLYYDDPLYGTKEAIAAKNELDVRSCNITLAYMPREFSKRRPSYGTTVEVAWAYALSKPVILVSDDPYVFEHPLISRCASWKLGTLEEAVRLIIGTFSVYEGR